MSSSSAGESDTLRQLRQRLSSLRDDRMNVTIERESFGATDAVIDNLGRRLDGLDKEIGELETQIQEELGKVGSMGLEHDRAALQLRLESLRDERRRVTIERESPSASEGAHHYLGIRLDRLDSEIADLERKLR